MICKYCNKEIPYYKYRERVYCSNRCHAKDRKMSEETKLKIGATLKKNNFVPWHKGLTKETDIRLRIFSEKRKLNHPWAHKDIRESVLAKMYHFPKGHIPWNKQELKIIFCKTCGKVLQVPFNYTTKFCTKECYWKSFNSTNDYGNQFTFKLKELIRSRDMRKCQDCGIDERELTERLVVHHLDANKQNNFESNLISLCRSCHGKTRWKMTSNAKGG